MTSHLEKKHGQVLLVLSRRVLPCGFAEVKVHKQQPRIFNTNRYINVAVEEHTNRFGNHFV